MFSKKKAPLVKRILMASINPPLWCGDEVGVNSMGPDQPIQACQACITYSFPPKSAYQNIVICALSRKEKLTRSIKMNSKSRNLAITVRLNEKREKMHFTRSGRDCGKVGCRRSGSRALKFHPIKSVTGLTKHGDFFVPTSTYGAGDHVSAIHTTVTSIVVMILSSRENVGLLYFQVQVISYCTKSILGN